VQRAAGASQKFTCPVVNAVDPALTDAVSVMTLPEATEVTGAVPDVTAMVVNVATLVCAKGQISNAANCQCTHEQEHAAAVELDHIETNLERAKGMAKKTGNWTQDQAPKEE
jgi:hypothetical protein